MPETTQKFQRLTVLAVYSWRELWSMGEGRGAPSFFLSITSFPKRGHDMHVLMPGRPGSPRCESYHGVTLHRFRSVIDFMPNPGRNRLAQHARLLFSFLYWFVRVLPVGLALARRVRPDVIFGMGELGAPAAFIVSRLRGVPFVTRFFGLGLKIEDVRSSPLKLLLRYREVAAFKTPSDYMIVHNDGSGGDELAAILGIDRNRFLFFLDGVAKDRFMTAERDRSVLVNLGVPDGNRVVLSVSRIYKEKHVDRLLRAAPGVLSERTDVTFLIVGEGEERDRLEALAAELGISGNVVFAGSVSHDDLPGIYASVDVFATLADRTNAFSTLYESMLSALPVVALNTGRTADFVDAGRTGVLLSREELPDLSRVILELLRDDARARSLGDAARAWMDETFPTIEERQAMEVEVLERAVSEHSA
ncbi:MAG: glycosyltransferase family 4 protein [Candidatus Eisenbacteria sp.]|nr:glycosyltransferase family 4 protein [Candidatus Eisenbacteria bacterium]